MLLLVGIGCNQTSKKTWVKKRGPRPSEHARSGRIATVSLSHLGLTCASIPKASKNQSSSCITRRARYKAVRWGTASTYFGSPVKVLGRPNVGLKTRDHRGQRTTMSLLSSGTIPLAAAAIVGGATALAYWEAVRMSRRPAIIRQKNHFNEAVLSRCPTIHEEYEVPLFLSNGHVETIAASKLRKDLKRVYVRELLTMPDGGTVALDYEDLKSARVRHR